MPSALLVTTVPITLEAFLLPFADRFRAAAWRVDGLANGASESAALAGHFDKRFDIAWSRNPLSPGNVLGSARRVREIVETGGYDVVHVHTPVASFVTRYALRGVHGHAGGPIVIYTAHGFHFYRGQGALEHAFFRTMERVASPWTDYLVTVNREDFDAARALGGVAPEGVRFIPGIGVDTEKYAPHLISHDEATQIRSDLGVPAGAFMLAMVAEFGAVKRHAHLFEAFAQVEDPDIVLVLVGDGPLESSLRERAVALGISSRIRWAGYRRDIPAVLEASDALVICSQREGLNRSVLEAMSAAKPVIGTDTRGIADAITPQTGWLAEKNSPASLARAIEAAAFDPAEARHRGDAGRERARAEYALPRIIDAYEELYREALASRV